MQGFDAAFNVVRFLPRFAGRVAFVGRYYGYGGKVLTRDEARALSDAGVGIVSVWEARGDQISTFTAAMGEHEAKAALAQAQACGQPEGSVIYFAVDFDASAAHLVYNIKPYFVAVGRVLDNHYQVGVYGSGMVCGALKRAAIADKAWLGGAMGWTESASYARTDGWDILQGLPADPYGFGVQIDPDQARGDFGMWSLATTPTPPHPIINIPSARDLQTMLASAGYYKATIDGDFGPQSCAALRAYYVAQ